MQRQRLLQEILSKVVTPKSRSITFEQWGSGFCRAIFVPNCRTPGGFLTTAKNSRWIYDLMSTRDERINFLAFASKYFSEEFQAVAEGKEPPPKAKKPRAKEKDSDSGDDDE